jgi:hypothetical protein
LNAEVEITNESNETRTFYVYLRDFKSEGESGRATLIIPGTEEGNFLASWISITNDGITLSPGQKASVPFNVFVPSNVGPGGYYGAIIFGTVPPKLQLENEDKGAGMAISQQTASLLLLRVKGDVIEEAQVREFNTDKDFYGTPFKVDFTVRIENSGNVHIKPRGAISIKNMFNKEVAVVKVNEKGGNILPVSIRAFNGNIWEDNFAFGRYTATLGMTYGVSAEEGGQGMSSLVSQKTFWIVPWRIIMPVFLAIALFAGLFLFFIKLYKNKAVRKAMERAGIKEGRYVKKAKGPSPALHFAMVVLIVFAMLFIVLSGIYFLFFS